MLAIDTFICYLWTVPLRVKSGNEVVCALSKMFKERVPEIVSSDKCLGHKMQSLFKLHLICHVVIQNDMNASYAERAI